MKKVGFRSQQVVYRARRALTLRRTTEVPSVVAEVDRQNLSYLGVPALTSLYDLMQSLDKSNVDGDVLEAGCAEGGSAIVLAAAKSRQRRLFVYDVFATIPPPSERDGRDVHERYEVIEQGRAVGVGGKPYYGYKKDLRAEVDANFARLGFPTKDNNVHLVAGLFEDTIRPGGPVALAHVDGDWYESVRVCLERILPALAPGGVVVVDDYYSWSGCYEAVNDVMKAASSDLQMIKWKHPRLWIRKRPANG